MVSQRVSFHIILNGLWWKPFKTFAVSTGEFQWRLFLSDFNIIRGLYLIEIEVINNRIYFFRIYCWFKIQHWRSSFPSVRVRSLASYARRSPSRRNETLPNLSRHKETKGVEGSVTRLGQLFGQIIELEVPWIMYLTSFTRILTFITWIFVALHKIF